MKFGFIVYAQVTAIDFTAPAQVFSQLPDAEIHLIGANYDAVKTDAGFSVNPTCSIQDAPQMDLLCIPGGLGQKVVSDDPMFMSFIEGQGNRANYVTSVCSGSLILAKAGLLDGFKATSHWATLNILKRFNVTPTKQRVVIDGNRITGGGATAGLDFGLSVVAQLFGEDLAKMIQLGLEYDPAPPFTSGSPELAGPKLTEQVLKIFCKAEII
ncbi:DJ-1/PfpI family protein [Paraglaciecola marina]|uniref:DJ-1/PfpI family protein n=1 Tax=Paraglaciecola marina TaxID=2500157 RepID=UPI00105DE800|nr:DJ-1/PfpI family protein [Paraglaciecola marina]